MIAVVQAAPYKAGWNPYPGNKSMPQSIAQRILVELNRIRLVDPHTHINPHAAASKTLADILGYHYYTELAHSAGLAREEIEEEGISPREKVARLVPRLRDIENTVQYSWLIQLCQTFFYLESETITERNWEGLYDVAQEKLSQPGWEEQVLERSGIEAVFLTNDFDDPLRGFDTSRYIPCLRTDDLVFQLSKPETLRRLAAATNVEVDNPAEFEQALGALFQHFTRQGARACAISLPPDFEPAPVSALAAGELFAVMRSDSELSVDERQVLAKFAFW
jgi:glucuronate isomerase